MTTGLRQVIPIAWRIHSRLLGTPIADCDVLGVSYNFMFGCTQLTLHDSFRSECFELKEMQLAKSISGDADISSLAEAINRLTSGDKWFTKQGPWARQETPLSWLRASLVGFDDAARNVDEQGAATRASSCSTASSSNATNQHMKCEKTLSAATTSSKAEQHEFKEFENLTTKNVKLIRNKFSHVKFVGVTLPTADNLVGSSLLALEQRAVLTTLTPARFRVLRCSRHAHTSLDEMWEKRNCHAQWRCEKSSTSKPKGLGHAAVSLRTDMLMNSSHKNGRPSCPQTSYSSLMSKTWTNQDGPSWTTVNTATGSTLNEHDVELRAMV